MWVCRIVVPEARSARLDLLPLGKQRGVRDLSTYGSSLLILAGPARFGMGKELFRAFQIGYELGVGCPLVGFILARLWWQAAKR